MSKLYEIRSWDGFLLSAYAPDKALRVTKALAAIGVKRHYVRDPETNERVWPE